MSHFYERLGLAVQLPQRGWPMHGVLQVAPENHEVVIYYSNSKLPVLEEQTSHPTRNYVPSWYMGALANY